MLPKPHAVCIANSTLTRDHKSISEKEMQYSDRHASEAIHENQQQNRHTIECWTSVFAHSFDTLEKIQAKPSQANNQVKSAFLNRKGPASRSRNFAKNFLLKAKPANAYKFNVRIGIFLYDRTMLFAFACAFDKRGESVKNVSQ